MRRVAQEHIDAALASVFGDSKQIAGREPLDEQQEGECVQAFLKGVVSAGAKCVRTQSAIWPAYVHVPVGGPCPNMRLCATCPADTCV